MRWRQVIVLYAVLAALGTQYWLVEGGRPELEASARRARPRFLGLVAADVRAIQLDRGGRSVVMRREDGGWGVVQPAGVDIPSDLMEAFLAALATAEEIDRMPAAPGDLHTFGLGDGASRVELTLAQAEPVVVLLGNTNPTGTALYARRASTPGVVLIGRDIRYYEDLIFQVIPTGQVPTGAAGARVGSRSPLTFGRRPV